jgi:DNA-binding MarR family transcriptional regulator
MRAQCTRSANATKVIVRHVWDDAKERVNMHRLTPKGKKLYERRKETVERSFADAKELHGHRYARFRSLRKVRAQCLMAAAAQNMKKMARLLAQLLRLLNAREQAAKRYNLDIACVWTILQKNQLDSRKAFRCCTKRKPRQKRRGLSAACIGRANYAFKARQNIACRVAARFNKSITQINVHRG